MKRILTWFRHLFFPPAGWPLWMRLSPFALSGGLFVVVLFSGVNAWEYTNSPEFCGTGCHTMPPEYASYQASPHAEVKCVECHIGREFVGNQATRKLGDIRHVVAMAFEDYEYPLHATNMRPATETCERCHSPEKFSDDSQRVIVHYAADETNTLTQTYLLMKTGGGTVRQGLGRGIHWHIQNEVFYYADDDRDQSIPYVQVINPEDGTTLEYLDIASDSAPTSVDPASLKKMDCITCHNRITHAIPRPEEAVDQALYRGLISSGIPEVRQKAVEALQASYETTDQAMNGIGGLDSYYRDTYPEFYELHADQVIQAVETLKEIYVQSVFPDQKVDWNTHPDNLGHLNDPGCFRCHDGKHLNGQGQAIRVECNLCHTIPVVSSPEETVVNLTIDRSDRPGPHLNANWIALHRYAYDPEDKDEICSSCHEIGDYKAADDSSFCANSACHGGDWEHAKLNALETESVFETLVQQLPHYPTTLAPIAAWEEKPSLDTIHRVQEEMVCEDCHETFPPVTPPSNEICISCHGETLPGTQALTAQYEPNPHDWHYGEELPCYTCHANFGPEQAPCALCHEDTPLKLKEGSGN